MGKDLFTIVHTHARTYTLSLMPVWCNVCWCSVCAPIISHLQPSSVDIKNTNKRVSGVNLLILVCSLSWVKSNQVLYPWHWSHLWLTRGQQSRESSHKHGCESGSNPQPLSDEYFIFHITSLPPLPTICTKVAIKATAIFYIIVTDGPYNAITWMPWEVHNSHSSVLS